MSDYKSAPQNGVYLGWEKERNRKKK